MRVSIKDLINPELYGMMSGDVHDNWERYILSEYKDQFKLNEGLILTHPLNKTLNVLDKSGYYIVEPKNENIFHIIVDEDTDITKLMKIASNLGWFPSAVSGELLRGFNKYTGSNLKAKLNEFERVYIRFEAKYDIEVNTGGIENLYHFTRKIYLPKIKKYGLTPKTTSKLSRHPERVYFAYTTTEVERFAHKFVNRVVSDDVKDKYPEEVIDDYLTAVILKIKVELIPAYFKVYDDPNYHLKACYTLNTVPFSAIKVVKEFSLNY
jgi:hypothetical protein